MKALINPQPGLIGLRTLKDGVNTAMALLGIGTIETDGEDTDHRIAQGFADIAVDPDPAGFVRDYYAAQAKEHPWVKDCFEPLCAPLRRPSTQRVTDLRAAASWLSTVAYSAAEHTAGADLLGRVCMEMTALTYKRPLTGLDYMLNLAQAMDNAWGDPVKIMKMRSMTDLWAGSGMRVIGVATVMREMDLDPQQVSWTLYEGDPMMRAICAVNLIAWELGDSIEIEDGSDYRRQLLTMYKSGVAPQEVDFTPNRIHVLPKGLTPEQVKTWAAESEAPWVGHYNIPVEQVDGSR